MPTPGAGGGYTNKRVPLDYKPTQEELDAEYVEANRSGVTKDGIKI